MLTIDFNSRVFLSLITLNVSDLLHRMGFILCQNAETKAQIVDTSEDNKIG